MKYDDATIEVAVARLEGLCDELRGGGWPRWGEASGVSSAISKLETMHTLKHCECGAWVERLMGCSTEGISCVNCEES